MANPTWNLIARYRNGITRVWVYDHSDAIRELFGQEKQEALMDHGQKHGHMADPAQPLIDLILPTLRQIQAGQTPTSVPLTPFGIFQAGIQLLSAQLTGAAPGPATPVADVKAGA